jgi:hypothetical protein
MNLIAADHKELSDLVEELNGDRTLFPQRFACFLAETSASGDDYYGPDQRKLLKETKRFSADGLLADGSAALGQLGDLVRKAAVKLCCEALLADVEFRNSARRSAYADGVLSTDATSGFVRETFDAIREQFEAADIDGLETGVGISEDEHTALLHYSHMKPTPIDLEIESGQVTFVNGLRVINFRRLPILKEERGVRYCFSLVKGALHLQILWHADVQNNLVIAELAAVRTEGRLVQEVRTTIQ